MLTEIKNRGVEDVCILICDGLKGLPDSVNTIWPLTTVQACLLHLIRNTFRYASRRDWDAIGKRLRPVYTALTAAAAEDRFDEFAAAWGARYPAVVRLWRAAWDEFIPFLDYDVEIRRIICSTNAIESLNARYRRAVRARPSRRRARVQLVAMPRAELPPMRGARYRAAISAKWFTDTGARRDPGRPASTDRSGKCQSDSTVGRRGAAQRRADPLP